ncbi:MAG: OmpA family protein [Acidobacteria bacterium]|nr:OmpA family protein [Acidobacteriota bacterium]
MFIAFCLLVQDVTLHSVQFPENKSVNLSFSGMKGAPGATIDAEVRFKSGQAQIELGYRNLKPAVLFGGDVTCYVLWAVTRDGSAENLGEVITADGDRSADYATGIKHFALMITAEPYYLVDGPSPLVMYVSDRTNPKKIASDPFVFSSFAAQPMVATHSIVNAEESESHNLVLTQAEKAFELAERLEAKENAPHIYRDARVALTQARNLDSAKKRRETIDYARRSVSHSNEAIRMTLRVREAQALAQRIAEQKAEFEAMQAKVNQSAMLLEASLRAQAESAESLAEAKRSIAEAEQQLAMLSSERAMMERERDKALTERDVLNRQKETLSTERDALMSEREILVQQRDQLRQEQSHLEQEHARLLDEKETLSQRLEGALSQVADTRASARGLIVSLPDILFDPNQAQLKPEAQVVIAKLAGILLVMRELTLQAEGHTDATGSADYNMSLSRKRAESVVSFLNAQGIDASRMSFEGFGFTQPVADNETKEGRAKNRRVEMIIKQ